MDKEKLKRVWNRSKGKKYQYKTSDYYLRIERATAYIHLEHSVELEDWLRNFSVAPTKTVLGGKTVYVHKGLLEAFHELREDLMPRIKGCGHVYLSGYSHGGGLAYLLATYLKCNTNKTVKECVTFGAPRVFTIWNLPGFFYIKGLLKDVVTVRNNRDIVPTVPFNIMGYFTVGTKVRLKQKRKYDGFIDWIKTPFIDHGTYGKVLND